MFMSLLQRDASRQVKRPALVVRLGPEPQASALVEAHLA
jgi:hypothetical protein